jgi:hypothetical protein
VVYLLVSKTQLLSKNSHLTIFLMQHPWSKTVRMAIDLEAMGIGGKSSIFQVCKLNFFQRLVVLVIRLPNLILSRVC